MVSPWASSASRTVSGSMMVCRSPHVTGVGLGNVSAPVLAAPSSPTGSNRSAAGSTVTLSWRASSTQEIDTRSRLTTPSRHGPPAGSGAASPDGASGGSSGRFDVPSANSGMQYVTDGKRKFIWFPGKDEELYFNLETDPQEMNNLIDVPELAKEIAGWRGHLIAQIVDRPEGFTDGARLIKQDGPTQAVLQGVIDEALAED